MHEFDENRVSNIWPQFSNWWQSWNGECWLSLPIQRHFIGSESWGSKAGIRMMKLAWHYRDCHYHYYYCWALMVSEDHEMADNWRRCRAEFEAYSCSLPPLFSLPLIRHSLLPSAHRRLTSRVARLWVLRLFALPSWPLCRVQCVFCVFYILSQLCVARCDCLLLSQCDLPSFINGLLSNHPSR
jgi:hypothetical protein